MDVFLSYAHKDKEIATRIADDLAKNGVQVWSDRDLVIGENLVGAVLDAVRRAPSFVAIVSRNTATAPFFSAELAAAIAAKEVSPSRKIVPVLVDKEAELPPFLDQYLALDISNPEAYSTGIKALSQAVREVGNGPLPRRDVLEKYEKISTGLVERLTRLTEIQELHRLHLEEQEKLYYLRGRVFGLLSLSSLVAVAIVAFARSEADTTAIVTLAGAILSLLFSFISGLSLGKRSRTAAPRLLKSSEAAHGD